MEPKRIPAAARPSRSTINAWTQRCDASRQRCQLTFECVAATLPVVTVGWLSEAALRVATQPVPAAAPPSYTRQVTSREPAFPTTTTSQAIQVFLGQTIGERRGHEIPTVLPRRRGERRPGQNGKDHCTLKCCTRENRSAVGGRAVACGPANSARHSQACPARPPRARGREGKCHK